MLKYLILIITLLCAVSQGSRAQMNCLWFTQRVDTVYVGELTSVGTFGTAQDCGLSITVCNSSNPNFQCEGGSISCLEPIPGPDSAYFDNVGGYSGGDLCPCQGQVYGSFFVRIVAIAKSSVVPNKDPQVPAIDIQNPITGQASIRFRLRKAAHVSLTLFDETGGAVKRLEREFDQGMNRIEIDLIGLPAGCYWYVLHAAEWVRSGKLLKADE